MAEEKKLSVEELDRIIKEVELETARQNLIVAQQQNREFREKQENNERITMMRGEAARAEQAENDRRRTACAHKTGGTNREGFIRGDGEQGYSVAPCVLPTGELYFMCLRCQKEWHHPAWVVKLEMFNTRKTTMTKARFEEMAKEYAEVQGWGHKLTNTAEASQFRIPLLDRINVQNVMETRP
jgi:hypothetical protein